ncbi:MAG TPA: iron-sulfur cluster assembly accessory protein [Candidatus Limnocylindria bacterium]|jgi:iron-sulfur cluster assembly accessory protein|nr:iron-sulfur cluster assembly accessory protein [Candidatus Limnocylindria bacterium]
MSIDGATTTVEVTPEAATKLLELRADDPKRAYLRLYVAGRSCCSFQYGLAFDAEPDETDAVTEVAGLRIAIDAQSRPYCDGTKVEWVDGPQGTGFLVQNPSLSSSCGCGG